jgi:hypothetical protein
VCDQADVELHLMRLTVITESFEKYSCGHQLCAECASRWISTELSEGGARVRCPGSGCSQNLDADDVERLGSKELRNTFMERSTRDHTLRTQELRAEPANVSWLGSAQECPECHVLVERSYGCNNISCLCGTLFCFSCGANKYPRGLCDCLDEVYFEIVD